MFGAKKAIKKNHAAGGMVCKVSRQAIVGEHLDHQAIRQRRAPPTNRALGGSSVHLSSTHHPNGARDLPNAFGMLIETWEYVFRKIPFWGVQSKQPDFE